MIDYIKNKNSDKLESKNRV